jgi:hypothetical protein
MLKRSSSLAVTMMLSAAACESTGPGDTGGGGGSNSASVTFHRDVEPILHKSCLSCHSNGRIGGFSLEKYEEARPLAASIVAATQSRAMPPWGALSTEGCEPRFPFKGDISLSDEELATLQAWADADAPEGDIADAPPPFVPPPLGLPNKAQTLAPEEPSVVEGDSDLFECVVYDPALTEEKWIDGIHLVPGNAKVAHHALTFRTSREDANTLSGGTGRFPCFGGAPGQIVHVWAPGGNPFELPKDVGIKLTPDDVLIVQMHYHPTGTSVEEDSSEVELRYSDVVPPYQFVVTFPGNAANGEDGLLPGPNDRGEPEFRVPAGVSDHTETMEIVIPPEIIIEVPILMAMTHMHYVGTDIRLDIERPFSASQPLEECLVHTPQWDFNWQRMYTYDTPIDQLPKGKAGDILKLTCHYDNSMGNPFVKKALEEQGLSAPVDVVLGEETLNEMCLAPLGILVPSSIDL